MIAKMTSGARAAAVLALTLCLPGCGAEDGSIMGGLELPTFGGDNGGGDQALEVPPDLDPPETKDTYNVATMRRDATAAVHVLPQRLGMRLRSEGGVSWLAVGATPDGLWPHLISFWTDNGFEIVDQSALNGYIETAWREQRLDAGGGFRVRDMFRMRVERAPDAVTNVYLANRKATFSGGEWRLAFSDRETEIEILYDLSDYLRSLSDSGRAEMPPLEDAGFELDVRNFKGAPALVIGRPYDRVWRGLGVALDRAGLSVRRGDRSRGVYLIRYRPAGADVASDAESAGGQLLQVRLLSQDDKTLVTVHPNRRGAGALPYETAQGVLNRIVRTYKARA